MYLKDRADGVKGNYCLARIMTNDIRYTEYYNKGKWCAFGQVFTEDEICKLVIMGLEPSEPEN